MRHDNGIFGNPLKLLSNSVMTPCRKAKGADADSKGRTANGERLCHTSFRSLAGRVGLLHWNVHNRTKAEESQSALRDRQPQNRMFYTLTFDITDILCGSHCTFGTLHCRFIISVVPKRHFCPVEMDPTGKSRVRLLRHDGGRKREKGEREFENHPRCGKEFR